MSYSKINYYLNKKILNNKIILFFVSIYIFFTIFILFLPLYKTNNYNLFFVEINSFQTYAQALDFTNRISNKTNSYFIHFDKKYRVLYSCFKNKKDAVKIASKLKQNFLNCNVYTLQLNNKIKTKNFNKTKIVCIKNISTAIESTINLLLNFSYKNKNKQSYLNYFYLKYFEQVENYNEQFTTFLNTFKTEYNQNESKQYLLNIQTYLNQILNQKNYNNLCNSINYNLTNIVFAYANFLNCFN